MTNYNLFRNIASRRRVGIWNGGNIVKAKLRGKQDKGWVYFVPNVVEIGFSSPANNMHQLFVGAAYDAPFALLVEREREREVCLMDGTCTIWFTIAWEIQSKWLA